MELLMKGRDARRERLGPSGRVSGDGAVTAAIRGEIGTWSVVVRDNRQDSHEPICRVLKWKTRVSVNRQGTRSVQDGIPTRSVGTRWSRISTCDSPNSLR